MFKILGSDGSEYGPVTAEQLRQWIREGRAGGQTQVKPEGADHWRLLATVPEFADVFRAPSMIASGAAGAMPLVVKIVAFLTFAVAGVTAIWQAVGVISILRFMGKGDYHPGFLYLFSMGVGLVSLPIRITSGIGLLRGHEWARRLAVGFGIIMILYGGWGLAHQLWWLGKTMSSDVQFLIRSPQMFIGLLLSVAVLLFNIATVFILTRKPVREAFAKKSSAAV